MNILTLNSGSSSLKYCLFRLRKDSEEVLTDGEAEHMENGGTEEAARNVIEKCRALGIDAVGHRVVHGGAQFTQPTRITTDVISALRGLSELDPLHNPTEVSLIETAQRLLPNIPSVAVFDTAFHQTLPAVAYHYALPRELTQRLELRRYGFHGISHQYVSETLLACMKRSAQGSRLVTCHLGSGASVCAIKNGKSIDTSMGLTPLEGLVMGTRSGDIDPGLLLYLLRTQNVTPDELDNLLNHQSGLLGLSGTSSDVRELEKSAQAGDEYAELALEVFAYRVSKYIGGYAVALEGIDAIAFTGGIGQHSSSMRSRICGRLAFLGVRLDQHHNEKVTDKATVISLDNSQIQVWVIQTDEERQIARETQILLSAGISNADSSTEMDRAF